MTKHNDEQLLKALVHDALVLCGGANERDIGVIRDELLIAEAILSNDADDDDRASVYDIVHPSTRTHYLP